MQWSMQRIRRTAVALALSSVVLSLAACSDDEPGPKAAEEPTAVETTPVAEQETPEEFIRRWNDVLNSMQEGDTGEWRSMTPECDGCARSADFIDEVYANGGYVKTDGRRVLSVKETSADESGLVFSVRTKSAPTELRRSSTAPIERMDGGTAELQVRIKQDAATWKFVDMWQVPE